MSLVGIAGTTVILGTPEPEPNPAPSNTQSREPSHAAVAGCGGSDALRDSKSSFFGFLDKKNRHVLKQEGLQFW